MLIHAHVQWPEVHVKSLPIYHSPYHALRRGLPEPGAHHFSDAYVSSAGIPDARCCHTQLPYTGARNLTWVLRAVEQTLYSLSHLPSSTHLLLKEA